MPLSVIGSMLFGGAFLGSYLNDKAYKETVKENLSRHTLTKREYCEHPVEYIRGEIYEMYENFKESLTDDTIIPDMFICYNELYKDSGYPESGNRFFRTEYNYEYIDTNSYYNWWEDNYNKVKVRIYPEISTKKQAEKASKEYHIDSLKKLAKKDIYPIDDWNKIFKKKWEDTDYPEQLKEWSKIFPSQKDREAKEFLLRRQWATEDCFEVQEIKTKTEYNPPADDTDISPLESEYFDYHFSHPVKTSLYINNDKNPLHRKQIRQIKSGIQYAKTAPLKVWKDRLVFESQGLLPTEYVVADYFLRWCQRKKIEIYEQEMKAFFNVLTAKDNPINYAIEYLEEYNKLSIEEQYQSFCDNNYYLDTLGEKYGFSKEFDATYDHFEEGTPLPANRNMNINIPNKCELEEFNKQAIPQSVPRAPAPTTHQLVRSPESTTGYDFRPKTENTSDFWHDLWIGFLLIGGALLFFLSIP